MSIFRRSQFLKAQNTHFGKLRTPSPPPQPPYLGLSPKIYHFCFDSFPSAAFLVICITSQTNCQLVSGCFVERLYLKLGKLIVSLVSGEPLHSDMYMYLDCISVCVCIGRTGMKWNLVRASSAAGKPAASFLLASQVASALLTTS